MKKMLAVIEYDHESNLYIGVVPGIPGCHTQAGSLDELQKNLKEVIELCLGEMSPSDKRHIPDFVGVQQVEV